jgi:hypothetical protein
LGTHEIDDWRCRLTKSVVYWTCSRNRINPPQLGILLSFAWFWPHWMTILGAAAVSAASLLVLLVGTSCCRHAMQQCCELVDSRSLKSAQVAHARSRTLSGLQRRHRGARDSKPVFSLPNHLLPRGAFRSGSRLARKREVPRGALQEKQSTHQPVAFVVGLAADIA